MRRPESRPLSIPLLSPHSVLPALASPKLLPTRRGNLTLLKRKEKVWSRQSTCNTTHCARMYACMHTYASDIRRAQLQRKKKTTTLSPQRLVKVRVTVCSSRQICTHYFSHSSAFHELHPLVLLQCPPRPTGSYSYLLMIPWLYLHLHQLMS